ncbi:sodium- and chloride-dependent transporter XTRP3-like [Actinia tenebrosa]|uniref:Transporter n=1 Tax=Actinia tenebrosa TaxID=6105 RepID=A0A6P8HXN6_ACTTE|nr:sodium- and chloride-dependent transporter XTRP3-like [Actinia tenebrosa]
MAKAEVENGEINVTITGPADEAPKVEVQDERGGWGNKIEFVLATIGYAVGLGNVWRFPYLCQKNGGGAFLIPYVLCLGLLGIPIFFLELAIGQSVRQGSIGVWNYIHPYLGGVGFASVMVCFLVGLYYNMIIAWCFYYLFASWQNPLPYGDCPNIAVNGTNITKVLECELAGRTQYYWYNNALEITDSIEESGGVLWHMALSLLLAWIVVFLCMMKGVQTAGKAVYFTATFPYLVLFIFFFRGVTLDGAGDGIAHMFKPQFHKLLNPQVWLEAATQIFYSLGVAFGGLIAMSSYNPVHNNCKRDAIMVSLINCGTSVFASIVIFSILGFKAHTSYNNCLSLYANVALPGNETITDKCFDLEKWLSESAQGPGLTFIAFTEAIVMMPVSQLWATLFFCMLLTLGLGSMFGTLEGVITPLYDLKLVSWRKEFVTAFICAMSYLIGLVFCQGSGEYWLQTFDSYSGTLPLLVIGFFELVGVNWIYGAVRFEDDIEYMIKSRPGWYWKITWRFVSPVIVAGIIIASIVSMFLKTMTYAAWAPAKADVVDTEFPVWGFVVIALLILLSTLCIPIVFLVKRFNIVKFDVSKQTQDEIIPPGALTPNLSRAPIALTEEPMDGAEME